MRLAGSVEPPRELAVGPSAGDRVHTTWSGRRCASRYSRFDRYREVAVDVEQIRPMPDLEAIAMGVFHPAETECVRVAADRRTEAFFHVWTAKEAHI